MFRGILFFFFCNINLLVAQSLTGTNGLFKIPSAYIFPDGSSYLGVSFLPKGSYELYGNGDKFTGMPSFITLSFYNRLEVMFRYTHQLGQVVSPKTNYFPDRMFSLRYAIIKESAKVPAITFGSDDFSQAFGASSADPWFQSNYFVFSKSLETSWFIFYPSVGYAFRLTSNSRSLGLNGIFGGIEFSLKQLPKLSFVAEYDSSNYNIALKSTFLKNMHIGVGFFSLNSLSGFVTYRFNLAK